MYWTKIRSIYFDQILFLKKINLSTLYFELLEQVVQGKKSTSLFNTVIVKLLFHSRAVQSSITGSKAENY